MSRQVGDERARYGTKSVRERLDDLWQPIGRHPWWVVAVLAVAAIGTWLTLVSRPVPVAEIRAGDCLYVPTAAVGTDQPIGEPADVERVLLAGGAQEAGCTASHGHEVSAVVALGFPVASGQTVTPQTLRLTAQAQCDAAFAVYVGHPLEGSRYRTFAALPTSEAFSGGSRTGFCLVARADGQWMDAPARNSGG
jgi:hypothetical protein